MQIRRKSNTADLPETGSELAEGYQEKYSGDLTENPFDPERPLFQRLEYAIWKYRKNHKFSERKKQIFDNYLKFGGINTGPSVFLGGGPAENAEDPEAAAAIDSVPDELEEAAEVNFTEKAQAYFGNYFIKEGVSILLQEFNDAPVLLDSLLIRYLQIRNVAPEYKEDITNAPTILAEAKTQLPKCKRVSGMMPGVYNKACTTFFSGELQLETWTHMERFHAAEQQVEESFVVFHSLGTKTVDDIRVFVKVAKIASNSPESTDADDLIKITLEEYADAQKRYDVLLEKKIVDI